MRAFLELLAVFAGLYLFDCIHWARRETVAFRAWWRGRARALAGEDMVGNQRHGVVLAQPILPFGRVFLTQAFPLSLTAETACSFVSLSANPGPRPAQVGRCARFDEDWKVAREARRVLVGGKLFVEAGSERLARALTSLLHELKSMSPKRREARIDTELARALDVGAIEKRVAAFEPAAASVRAACTAELVLVFVLTPAVALWFGLPVVWIPLLASLVLAQVMVVVAFVRAHRALFPKEVGARRGSAIILSLSPPAAMRAVDALSRDLLAEFHPLAVARVLLPEAEFRAFAEKMLRDAHHPLPIRREGAEPEVSAAAESWRLRSISVLERFALENGLADSSWTKPPELASGDCLTWCPRCAQQYTVAEGTCARCWDLALERF